MNFFFGLKNDFFLNEITIPKFQNNNTKNLSYTPYECYVEKNEWKFNKAIYIERDNFYTIENDNINEKKIFFLSNEKEVKENFDLKKKLINLNYFTDTKPIEYRSNLKVYLKEYGFSSYQSEYPYEMTKKTGSIITPISSLLNKIADKNFILFRNIYFKPIKHEFNAYLLDLQKKIIVSKFIFQTNQCNQIEIQNSQINENIFFITENFIGIPIFVSLKDGHISLEHTHPPHLYILGQDKFKKVKEFKENVKKIFNR